MANAIQQFQKQHLAYLEGESSKNIDDAVEKIVENANDDLELENVANTPLARSRAGIYVYLNSLFAGAPFIDDGMILNYLNVRYKVSLPGSTCSNSL
jgi:mediator of RNA polymerase II transcription subunit 5